MKFEPNTVMTPPEYVVLGDTSTPEAMRGPAIIAKIELTLIPNTVEGLPTDTLTEQLPAMADVESTMTTLPDDAMLHAAADTEHTVALQLCEPKIKLAPNTVTVLPAYTDVGDAEVMVGLALICSAVEALLEPAVDGFEKLTLTLQLPALSDTPATITILVPFTMAQLLAATPHTAAEQFWVPLMKLLPVTVTTLPAYAELGSTELMDGAPNTASNPDTLVAAAVDGLLTRTTTTQLPAMADVESTMTTLPDDAMLHAAADTEHTVALQLCEPKIKLAPNTVTVLPAYTDVGDAEVMVGLALICSAVEALLEPAVDGFEKLTLTLQLPALSDTPATITILVPFTMAQLLAATPHTAAEQFWVPLMKLLPVTVTTLPAYAELGSTELMDGAPNTASNPDTLVAAAVDGLLTRTTTTQLPAMADGESTMTTLPDDAMLHAAADTEHTVALQLCEPKIKLAPNKVTVLPAYTDVGDAEVMVGLALICRSAVEVVAVLESGLLKYILMVQFPMS